MRLPSFKSEWRADSVAQILGNPAYIAQTYSERRSRRLGEAIAAAWPAIIDRPMWDRVQAKLARFHRKGGRRDQGTGLERSYAFQGLLRCLGCGRRLHVHPMRGRTYYYCRGERANGCRQVREEVIHEAARAILARIEPSVSIDYRRKSKPRRPADALARLDATIDRLGKRFEWGDIDEESYRTDLARYRALRAEMTAEAEAAALPERLRDLPGDLLGAWEAAVPAFKRGLFATFFEELDVEDGEVVGCKLQPAMSFLTEAIEASADRSVDVAPAGFEPAISALRGLRPGPLDDGAVAKRRAVGN